MAEGPPGASNGRTGGPGPRVRWAFALVVVGAVLWGVVATMVGVRNSPEGRDFATYAYAAEAAWSGGDPYDTAALEAAAIADGATFVVHPFVYPPSFLLFTGWIPSVGLTVAYPLWVAISGVCLAVLAILLGRRPFSGGRWGPWVAALAVTVGSVSWDNLLMGQVNVVLLLFVVAAVSLASGPDEARERPPRSWVRRARPWLAGVLVGLAVALKGPAILVLGWFLIRGRWRPAVAAALVTGGLLAASAAVFGPELLVTYATRVVPSLADGTANGLRIPIELVANHSPASLFHGLAPADGPGLSPTARVAATALRLVVLVGLGVALWRPPADALARGAQVAAVLVASLLLPVFTFEHHLILALPAVVVLGTAAADRRLPRWALPPLAAAVAVWAVDIAWILRLGQALPTALVPLAAEAKLAAVAVLLLGCVGVGRGSVVERR